MSARTGSIVAGPTMRSSPITTFTEPKLQHFLRAVVTPVAEGFDARLTGPQGSGILTSMVKANALLVVPEQSEAMQPGEEAVAIPLDSGDEAQHDLGY